MPTLPKRPLIVLAVLAALLAAWLGFAAWYDHHQREEERPATYSALIEQAGRGELSSITFANGTGHAVGTDGSRYRVVMPVTDDLLKEMRANKVAIRHSTCPHDCPSACALDVEVIDGTSIGRVRGSKLQTYTAGVVCAKVARYAERRAALKA